MPLPQVIDFDQLTAAEVAFIQNLAGLSFVEGDIIYHDATDLTRLPIGTATQVLTVNAGATAPEWSSASAPTFADNEEPTGAINGVNVTFTLAVAPSPAASLILVLNGIVQIQGKDYSLSGTTITMDTAPSTGSVLRAWSRS